MDKLLEILLRSHQGSDPSATPIAVDANKDADEIPHPEIYPGGVYIVERPKKEVDRTE